MTVSSSPLKNSSLGHRFLSGASWVFSGKVLSAGSKLAGNALLARLLSTEEMGNYFLVFSIVSIFSICGMWGLDRGLVKLVASELAHGYTALVRGSILTSFIIVSTFSVLIAVFLNSPAGEWILITSFNSTLLVPLSVLIGLWILIKAMQGLVSESFRGFHDIRMATIFGGLVTSVISMLFYLHAWILQGSASLEQIVQMTIFAAGISLLTGLVFLFRKMRHLDRGGKIAFPKILHFGFPLFLTSISLFGIREFHIWILAVFQPESEVALYGSAMRLGALLTMPLIIINSVIPPMIADLYSQKDYTRVQSVLQKTATLMSIPAFIVSAVIFIFGADILGLIYGEPYREAFIVFVILTVGQLLNVLTGSPGILLTMSGHERIVMKSALSTGIIGIIVSIIGVQAFGAIGAAVGYAVGIVMVNVVMWAYAYKKLSIRTHGSPTVMRELIRKLRIRIESDGTNGGTLAPLDKIIRTVEEFWWRICGYKIIECFGDSHVSVFRGLNYKDWIGKKRFRTISVRGATAYGIGNPNSKTNALQIFQAGLKNVPTNRTILFMMGEVDVGFLVWSRAQHKGLDAKTCMEDAWCRYTEFLSNIKKSHPRLIVCSVPLPTIGDNEKLGGVANARSEITATQHQRTMMTLEFNRKLKKWADELEIEYLDFDLYALDPDTHLVKKSLLNKNTTDHHYDKTEFHLLIKNLIHILD